MIFDEERDAIKCAGEVSKVEVDEGEEMVHLEAGAPELESVVTG